MLLDDERPAKKAYEYKVVREVGFENGLTEICENTIPADTIEEAIMEAADRNEQNELLRCVAYAMTIEVKLIRREEKNVNNTDES